MGRLEQDQATGNIVIYVLNCLVYINDLSKF